MEEKKASLKIRRSLTLIWYLGTGEWRVRGDGRGEEENKVEESRRKVKES
jgi:hypothetical protein